VIQHIEPNEDRVVNLGSLKKKLEKKLPRDSPVLGDLLREPDLMPLTMAEVLIPHFLRRLERELDRSEVPGKPVLLS
jgi:hypothetical protein